MTGKRDIHGKKIRHKKKKITTRNANADNADTNAAKMVDAVATSTANMDDEEKRREMQATLKSSSLWTPQLQRAWKQAEYEAYVDPYRGMAPCFSDDNKDNAPKKRGLKTTRLPTKKAP